MSIEKMIELFKKYESGNSTPYETQLVEQWLDSYQVDERDSAGLSAEERESDLRLLFERIGQTNRRNDMSLKRRQRIRMVSGIAAVIVVLVSLTFLFRNQSDTELKKAAHMAAAPLRGSDAVRLIVNNESLDLESSQHSISISEGKIRDGVGKSLASSNGKAKLITPKGRTYTLMLSDGTKVVLNAMSSIEFPTKFEANNAREVKLDGEGYFEVSKKYMTGVHQSERVPFLVATSKQLVEVLGTHFNIRAYADDNETHTTLIEGRIKVSEGSKALILKPGQEFVSDAGGSSLRVADEDVALSWMNGRIVFDDEPLDKIMRRLARWYDMDVIYKRADRNKLYGGSISMHEGLEQALRQLELTGGVHFEVEGRTIYVTN